MICLRHEHCRRALAERARAWPTATYPRTFITITLGSIGLLLMVLYVMIAFPFLGWLAFTGQI